MATESSRVKKPHAVRDGLKEATAAINFWQALEYLAPQSPPAVKLEDSVWEFDSASAEKELPWQDPRKRLLLDRQIGPDRTFQIFAGILGGGYFIEAAREYLGAPTIDQREMRPPSSAACVVINVDAKGVANGEIFISTVPWAMAQISKARDQEVALDFRGFFGIGGLEERVCSAVLDLMVARKILLAPIKDASGDGAKAGAQTAPASVDVNASTPSGQISRAADTRVRPITSDDITAITDLVFLLVGWRPVKQEMWRVKAFWAPPKKATANAELRAVQDDPLNSFYAEDLENLGDAMARGDIGVGLQAYLKGEDSIGRVDLESRVDRLIEGVHPANAPAGCWPAKYPLVTAQQFAVNTVKRELASEGGLFSVNGPPGTGKTTMLKDIIAAVVVSRAEALVQFDIPESAFRQRLAIENYAYPAYQVDDRLRGFGIVVSSANNGAVENITKELPGLASIDPDIDIDYFSLLAESLAAPPKAERRSAKRERWGVITAVLGNKTNRSQFATRFWFAGLPPKQNDGDPEPLDPMRLRSLQDLMKTGDHGALSWEEARKQYREAREKVDALTRTASEVIDAMQVVSHATEAKRMALADMEGNLEIKFTHGKAGLEAKARLDAAEANSARAQRWVSTCTRWQAADAHLATQEETHATAQAQVVQGAISQARTLQARAAVAVRNAQSDFELHLKGKPGLFSELFRTQSSQHWNTRDVELDAQVRIARTRESRALDLVAREEELAQTLDDINKALDVAKANLTACANDAKIAGVPFDFSLVAASVDRFPPDLLRIVAQTRDTAIEQAKDARDSVAIAQSRVEEAQAGIVAAKEKMVRAESDLTQSRQVLGRAPTATLAMSSWDLANQSREVMHRSVPYDFPALFEARRDVFVAAMNLHQAFIAAAWKPLSRTLSAFVSLLQGTLNPSQVTKGQIHLWDAFFLVVPVVSTTFASFPRLFRGVGRQSLAWLMVDEAGQATPQQAAGAIWRSKRAVIVGDPRQLEPVVGVPGELMEPLLRRCSTEPQWAPPFASAQTLADRANRYGMYFGEVDSNERAWLGSPLLVHRRCLDPMFCIANSIAYDNKMVYGTGKDRGPQGIGPSRWIDIPADSSDGHWIETQAEEAMELVEALTNGELKENGQFKVYVITPFRAVANKIKQRLYARYRDESKGMAGTVHTFQGKEAEHVIFLLGGDPLSPGVISSFAGAKPNLVNVAVTRAKRRLYVIGDRRFWTGPSDAHRIFNRMAEFLDGESVAVEKTNAEA